MRNQATSRTLKALAFASGFAALGSWLLGLRGITTLLGDTFQVHDSALVAVMIGLGVGARLAPFLPRAGAPAQLVTGLWVIAFPFVIALAQDSPGLTQITSSSGSVILIASLLVLLPGLTMGLVLPLFTKRLGGGFPSMCLFHAMGGSCSVLLVELVAWRTLGLEATMRCLGLVNVGVALAFLRLDSAGEAVPTARETGVTSRRVAFALFLAGAAGGAYQALCSNLGQLVFLPHRENTSLILAISIAGLALGALLAGRYRSTFSTWLLWIPFVLGITFTGYPAMLVAFRFTEPADLRPDVIFVFHKALFAAALTLPVATLFGALMPALIPREAVEAHSAARLLPIACLAGAAGHLAWDLVLHPSLPVSGGCAVISLGCWIAASIADGRASAVRTLLLVAGVTAVTTLLVTWEEADFYHPAMALLRRTGDEVLTVKHGPESATLHRGIDEEVLSVNGGRDIPVQERGRTNPAELMSGMIAGLTAPRRERALVVGLGTGITAGTVARLFADTDVVEGNPALLDLAPKLTHVTMGLARNVGARIHLADGRAFLSGRSGEYDAIVLQDPPSRGFTLELFRLVRRALRPDGVVGVRIPAGELTEEGIGVLLVTLREVFPHGSAWNLRDGAHQLVVAAEPIRPIRVTELEPIHPTLARELEVDFGAERTSLFEDAFRTDRLFEADEVRQSPLSTDDRPLLELLVVRGSGSERKVTGSPRWGSLSGSRSPRSPPGSPGRSGSDGR